jgi:hypothetical protein
VKKTLLFLSMIVLLTACGKHSRHSSSAAPKAAEPVVVKETTPITPKEEEFVKEVQTEYKLPEASVETIKTELEKEADPYTKSNIMFCVGVGRAAVIELAGFSCRSFRGDKIEMTLMGAGISFSAHADVLVLYAKKGSRHLKEGTYTVGLSALHLGFGLMGLKITNDNMSINWRMKGLTLGLGMDNALARMTVKKI